MPDDLAQTVEESTATTSVSPSASPTSAKPTPSVSAPTSQVPAPTEEGPAPVAVDPSVLRDILDGVNTANAFLEGEPTSAPTGPLVLDDMQFGALGIGLAFIIALLGALLIATVRR